MWNQPVAKPALRPSAAYPHTTSPPARGMAEVSSP